MECDQLLEVIGSGLPLQCEKRGDDEFELTLPLQGLDGYGIRFWTKFDGRTWSLSDDGHLSHALSGVTEEKLEERISIIAGELPISLLHGALVAHLAGASDDENRRILATAVEAVLAAWTMRLEQPVPTLEASMRDMIADVLRDLGVRSRLNIELKGRTGLTRRFDLAAGDSGRGLLRATDTDDPSYFQRVAELYIISAVDVRAAQTGLQHRFVFAWNEERLMDPNPLVLRELETAEIRPTGDIEEAAQALAS